MDLLQYIQKYNEGISDFESFQRKIELRYGQFGKDTPSIDEILSWYHDRFLLLTGNAQTHESLLHHLIYETNLSAIGIGSVDFYPDFDIFDENVHFFAQFGEIYLLGLNKESKVVIFEEDSELLIQMDLDIEKFLIAMLTYHKLHEDFIYKESIPSFEVKEKMSLNCGKTAYDSFFEILLSELGG